MERIASAEDAGCPNPLMLISHLETTAGGAMQRQKGCLIEHDRSQTQAAAACRGVGSHHSDAESFVRLICWHAIERCSAPNSRVDCSRANADPRHM